MKEEKTCETCVAMFCDDSKSRSLGTCDNDQSPRFDGVVFYDTPACEEYEDRGEIPYD